MVNIRQAIFKKSVFFSIVFIGPVYSYIVLHNMDFVLLLFSKIEQYNLTEANYESKTDFYLLIM